ncbi:MAG: hypothetical protein K8W52_22900 [Deltaproteobacteria bacterium]|nr:hypothetical protein [Deltaproteobacteria bacterium]
MKKQIPTPPAPSTPSPREREELIDALLETVLGGGGATCFNPALEGGATCFSPALNER